MLISADFHQWLLLLLKFIPSDSYSNYVTAAMGQHRIFTDIKKIKTD